jgi:hypothetical protein
MSKATWAVILLSVLLMQFSLHSNAQKLASLDVTLNNENSGIDVPVHVNLDGITQLPDSILNLVEIKGSQKISIPYQIENKGQRVLYWIVKQTPGETKHRVFELQQAAPIKINNHITLAKDSGYLTIMANNKNLLRYVYKTAYPPKGIDTAYKRSGFIHPLWSPYGDRLTRIQAPDHYHHYGLWDPWTHTAFDGDTIDFWNLNGKHGTVKFANFTSITDGPVYGDFQVLQQHIAFLKHGPDAGKDKLALNELQSVRIYQPAAKQDYYILDITIQLNCADLPIKLLAYRYGGLGWRATEKWDGKNSEMLTSEGKTRDQTDNTNARWVIVQGEIDKDYAGAVMMSNPTNYSYPEPLRVWNSKTNGRGDVYANFSPTKDKDWNLTPGHDYLLKYRFIVFNNKYTKDKAEAAWQYFAHPPVVKVTMANVSSSAPQKSSSKKTK